LVRVETVRAESAHSELSASPRNPNVCVEGFQVLCVFGSASSHIYINL